MVVFSSFVAFYSRIFILIVIVEYSVESPVSFSDLQSSADIHLQDLIEKYADSDSNDFWQPFTLITDENREAIHIDKIAKKNFRGNYLSWKHVELGPNNYLIGLSQNSVDIYGPDFQKITSFATLQKLVGMTLYTRWNEVASRPEIIILLASIDGVEVLRVVDKTITKFPDFYRILYKIKDLKVVRTGADTRILILPAEARDSLDIYNIAVDEKNSTFWFHQKVPIGGRVSAAVIDVGQVSVVAIASAKVIHILSFEKGFYEVSQQIPLNEPCLELASFTLVYQHFLASVPQHSSPVEFFSVTAFEFVREEKFGKIHATQAHPVSIEDYRDEPVLAVKQLKDSVEFYSFDVTKKSFEVGFNCTSKDLCSTNADLSNGANFFTKDGAVYVLPSVGNSPSFDVFFISKRFEHISSPAHQASRNVFSKYEELSRRFAKWEGIIEETREVLRNSLSRTNPNIITAIWRIGKLSGSEITVNEEKIVHSDNDQLIVNIENIFSRFRFVESIWNDQDFEIQMSSIENEINKLKDMMDEANRILQDSVPINSEDVQVVKAKQLFSGSLRTEQLDSTQIQVKQINDETDVDEFFKNIIRKEDHLDVRNSLKYRGKLSVGNLETKILRNIQISDIARLSEQNSFHCPLHFITPFDVQGNILAEEIGGFKFSKDIIRASDVQGVTFSTGIVAAKEATIEGEINSVKIEAKTFEKLLSKTKDQTITARYFFEELESKNPHLRINKVNDKDFKLFMNSVVLKDFNRAIKGQKTVTGKITTDDIWIESELNGIAFPHDFVTGSRAVISGRKKFAQLTADTVSLSGKINNISTSSVVSALGHSFLKKTWTFKDSVTFMDNLSVKNHVDGVKMEALRHVDTLDEAKSNYNPNANVVFKQPVHFGSLGIETTINTKTFDELFGGTILLEEPVTIIKGLTTFKENVTFHSLDSKSGKVNELEIKTFFTKNTEQEISGRKVMGNSVKFSGLTVLGKFDSVDLPELFENAFTLSKARTISSRLTFEHVSCGSTMKVVGRINNFDDFASDVAVLRGRESQTFQTSLEFDELHAQSAKITNSLQLTHGKTVNGLDIDLWYTTRIRLDNPGRISGPFEVFGNVAVRQNVVTDKINEVLISHLRSGVLRSDRTHQTFLEKVDVSSPLQVFGEILFERQLSGFSLNQIKANAFLTASTTPEIIEGIWHFESLVVDKDITVKAKTCGVDLTRLDVDSVRTGEPDVHIVAAKDFQGGLQIMNELVVSSINSKDCFTNVFTLRTDQTISKEFVFHNNVNIESLTGVGLINKVSLAEMARTYSFSEGTHFISLDLESDESFHSDTLIVMGLVQSQKFKEFLENKVVKINSKSRIRGKKTFSEEVVLNGNIEVNSLNRVSVDRLFDRILKRTEPIAFTRNVVFEDLVVADTLTIVHGDLEAPEIIDGVNFKELTSTAVVISEKLTRVAFKLESAAIMKNIDDVITLNGIPLKDIVTLNERQDVGTLHVLEAHLSGTNVEVGGLISGLDIRKEFANTLKLNSENTQMVTGHKNFEKLISIQGNFICRSLNVQDVVSVHENNVINTKVKFANRVQVRGDLRITGLVNGQSIEEMLDNGLTNGRNEEITGFYTFNGGVTFKEDVKGEGLLNGFNISNIVPQKLTEAKEAKDILKGEIELYEKTCQHLDSLHVKTSESPVRLYSFDQHQTIQLQNSVTNMITLQSEKTLYLITTFNNCELTLYQWNSKDELFKEKSNNVRLGHVDNWYTDTYRGNGILVATVNEELSADCPSTVIGGLYVIKLDGAGNIVPPVLLKKGVFLDVKLVQNNNQLVLLAQDQDQSTMQVFLYSEEKGEFDEMPTITFDSHVTSFQAIPHLDGTVIFFGAEDAAVMAHYSFVTRKLKKISEISFLSGKDTRNDRDYAALFSIKGIPYGLKQVGGNEESIIQPDCTLQSFQLFEGELKLFQKLKTRHTVSLTTITLDDHVYLLVLSKYGGILVYEFAGLAGFKLLDENPIPIVSGSRLISFMAETWRSEISIPFIAISTKRTIEVLHANVQGDHAIYKGPRVCKI